MKMKNKTARGLAVFLLLVISLAAESARGNAVAITNVAVLNVSNGTAELHFDISWSNSWRTVWTDDGGFTFVTNWDAAWVFAKQRVSGGEWNPVYFTTNGHSAAAGFNLQAAGNGGVTNPGVLIYRSADGAGGVSLQDVILRWDYVASGLYGTNEVDYAVFATEMVYIPQGAYSLGSGGSENGVFYTYPTPSQPFRVTNENAMTVGTVTGALNIGVGGYSGSLSGTLSNAYPKGYGAFYAMKYEISQGQYVDFLNHISPGRAIQRYPEFFGSSRYTITFTNSSYVATAPDRACNYLGWDDTVVFLDWAGLRPLTELEYEKTCRGFRAAVPEELAFGDIAPVFAAASFIGVDGSGTEVVASASANVNGNNMIPGPIRVGIFATTNSTRFKSGAGYFGNMELSGNVAEWYVTVGDTRGRAFIGEPGDGNPIVQPASWPKEISSAGFGQRGGGSPNLQDLLRLSDRYWGDFVSLGRASYIGGRGGRTAP